MTIGAYSCPLDGGVAETCSSSATRWGTNEDATKAMVVVKMLWF